MKKSAVIALAVQGAVLFALPGVTWFLRELDSYFVAAILILMGIHPLCCLGMGIFAGLHVKNRWWLVLSGAVLALCGDWLFFDFQTAFLYYAGINLLLGALGMAATAVVQRARGKSR